MNKVFVVLEVIPYEGSIFLGVNRTLVTAKRRAGRSNAGKSYVIIESPIDQGMNCPIMDSRYGYKSYYLAEGATEWEEER